MQQQYPQQMQPQMQGMQPMGQGMQGMQPMGQGMQGMQPMGQGMQGFQPMGQGMQGMQPMGQGMQGMQPMGPQMQGMQSMGPQMQGMQSMGPQMQGMQPMGPQAQGMPSMGAQGAAPLKKPKRRVLTSLTLQIFIYFGALWDIFYYILNLLVFFYKGLALPYPQQNFDMEFSFSWLWILVEIPRLILLSAGNKTEKSFTIIWSFIAGAPVIGMFVYFVAFQTYVLKIDEFLNGVSLAFIGVQALLSLVAIFRFWTASRFQQAQTTTQQ